MEVREHINEIAIRAAEIYGQAWSAIPHHAREKWAQTVENVISVGANASPMERAASQAIEEWKGKVETIEAPVVDTKAKLKKR